MSKTYRVGKELLEPSLVQEIDGKVNIGGPITWSQITDAPNLADGNWKPPVATYDDLPLRNNKTGDIRLVLNTNIVYTWKLTFWDEIGANDNNIFWSDIKEKPVEFTPSPHQHDWVDLTGKPTEFLPSIHTHTMSDIIDLDIYTRTEIDTLSGQFVFAQPGKQLSSNDFTNLDKSKLDSLSENASVDYATMLNQLETHKNNQSIHLSQNDITLITSISSKAEKTYVDTELGKKATATTVNGHIANSAIHLNSVDKALWNGGITTVSPTQPPSGVWFKII